MNENDILLIFYIIIGVSGAIVLAYKFKLFFIAK